MLRARRIDDDVGRGDLARASRGLSASARLRASSARAAPPGRRADERRASSSPSGRSIRKISRMRFCALASTIASSLPSSLPSVVDRDEKRIAAVGDVLDEAGGQAEEGAVIVDGAVEIAPPRRKAPAKTRLPRLQSAKLKRPTRRCSR